MDFGASNHMVGITFLFSSYDTNTYTHKVSISNGKQLLVVGSNDVKVPNGTLNDVFHVQGMPINFLSIYRAYQKYCKFESWLDKYVLKDIKHNFKVVLIMMLVYISLLVLIDVKSTFLFLYSSCR